MKHYLPYLPALALALVAALWLHLGSGKNTALESAIAAQRATLVAPDPPDDRAALAAESEARILTENNAALRAQLRLIEEATAGTKKETAAVQMKIPPSLDAEVTESFGRITDMGAEFGQYCRLISPDPEEAQNELKRRGLKADDLSDCLMTAFMKFAAWAPEISAFEDTPAEIASLQSIALRETFALSDTQTKQAEAIIRAHFATMKTAGLTYSSHEAPGWRERRSASLTQLLWQLRPLIPANSKQTPSLAQIVNLGSGLETKTIDVGTEIRDIAPAPGASQPTMVMVQAFPDWPAVPWLPAKRSASPQSAKAP